MKKLQFKCTLLTDVILNVKSASEGSNRTLDFIPGNNFLGMVAARLYKEVSGTEALDLFHNGVVRYGDAHPAVKGRRSLKVPAAIYYPKLDKCPFYVNFIDEEPRKKRVKQQLKQCRAGFYIYHDNGSVDTAGAEKAFALKSAYNRELRHSKDGQMFGYESLESGLTFFFSVETDKEEYAPKIKEALIGRKHLGRSRNAQYGLVEIEACPFEEEQSYKEGFSDKEDGNLITVYADSRLIFLDEYGMPTFQPDAAQLGVDGGEVDWGKSQIRTFQYAPWNGKRRAFDTDRCGIEKGSVFVIKGGKGIRQLQDAVVGSYRNEGFGHVLYNPRFLKTKANDAIGTAFYDFKAEPVADKTSTDSVTKPSSPLIAFLENSKADEATTERIYKEVNDFVTANKAAFRGESFASQWGTIRSIAMAGSSKEDIYQKLFEKETGYLRHGLAVDKWNKNKRLEKFEKTFGEFKKNYNYKYMKFALVNLAAQMAKANSSGKEEKA